MIQVTWHFALLIITIIIGFIWAITRDNNNGGGFIGITSRDVAIIIWIILLIVIVPIYGGIFWW